MDSPLTSVPSNPSTTSSTSSAVANATSSSNTDAASATTTIPPTLQSSNFYTSSVGAPSSSAPSIITIITSFETTTWTTTNGIPWYTQTLEPEITVTDSAQFATLTTTQSGPAQTTAASQTPIPTKSSSKASTIAPAVIVPVVVLLLAAVAAFILLRRRRARQSQAKLDKDLGAEMKINGNGSPYRDAYSPVNGQEHRGSFVPAPNVVNTGSPKRKPVPNVQVTRASVHDNLINGTNSSHAISRNLSVRSARQQNQRQYSPVSPITPKAAAIGPSASSSQPSLTEENLRIAAFAHGSGTAFDNNPAPAADARSVSDISAPGDVPKSRPATGRDEDDMSDVSSLGEDDLQNNSITASKHTLPGGH